jgi:L-threonylcarbamoyladenylate synthase
MTVEAKVISALDSSLNESISIAAGLLKRGEVVAFPTETVYGLGACALDKEAVSRIFAAKGRPSDNPLIIHISSMEMLKSITTVPEIYTPLIEKYWPGPLTILLPRGELVPLIVTGGHDTVAVRMPSNPVALALIEACGFPLAAPSANTSGRPSPTLASHVYDDLNGRIHLILDGGQCNSGVESTVVDGLSTIPAILRPGGITADQVRSCRGFEKCRVWQKDFTDATMESAPTTPGMKYTHYSPNCDVVLVRMPAGSPSEAKLAQRRTLYEELATLSDLGLKIGILRTISHCTAKYPGTAKAKVTELFIGSTSREVAFGLFKGLRDLEQTGAEVILVEGVSDDDEGLAVMNRLVKAASRSI